MRVGVKHFNEWLPVEGASREGRILCWHVGGWRRNHEQIRNFLEEGFGTAGAML